MKLIWKKKRRGASARVGPFELKVTSSDWEQKGSWGLRDWGWDVSITWWNRIKSGIVLYHREIEDYQYKNRDKVIADLERVFVNMKLAFGNIE